MAARRPLAWCALLAAVVVVGLLPLLPGGATPIPAGSATGDPVGPPLAARPAPPAVGEPLPEGPPPPGVGPSPAVRPASAGGPLLPGPAPASGGGSWAAADLLPPDEAYQPTATKNWWYVNAHLYDEAGDLRFDLSAAIVLDHGGDVPGHLLLFTLVDYETGEQVAGNAEGIVRPDLDAYGATFTGPSASARLERVGSSPDAFELALSGPYEADLRFETDYAAETRKGYREGAGLANVLFWNQAQVAGNVTTDAGTHNVTGVGFAEHVWGTWSRIPQKGIDFVNVHLATADAGDGPPTDASVYLRRTFYHGSPGPREPPDDVGPVLFLTADGQTWHEASTIDCTFDGAPCRDHRTGTPGTGQVQAWFPGGGHLNITLDPRPHATIAIPSEDPAARIHEGAADVDGTLRLPGEEAGQNVTGIAQTEHQRFAPFYEH